MLKPKKEDFPNWEEYQEALIRFEVQEALKSRVEPQTLIIREEAK